MKNTIYSSPKASWLMKLFWKAAGADHYILERSTYSDQVKYTCLGGIVVSTGLMAGIAGGYAFYTIFEPNGLASDQSTDIPTVLISMLFAVIWGAIIFNIDRFIVTSTGKGDGTEAITGQEFKSAIPRIILGIIIAITISKPLEIRMFKSEIDVELLVAQQEKQKEFMDNIDVRYKDDFEWIDTEIDARHEELNTARENASRLEDEYINETQGERGNGYGVGPVARGIETRLKNAEERRDRLEEEIKPKIEVLNAKRAKLEEIKNKEIKEKEFAANGLDGLLQRIHLAHKIAGTVITLFITLLFVAIELTPIFFKMMLIKSPYDFMEENIKEVLKAEQGIEVQYDFYKDKKGMERDLVIHHRAGRSLADQQKLLDAEKELSNFIIQQWLEAEKEKVKANPYLYINENDPGKKPK